MFRITRQASILIAYAVVLLSVMAFTLTREQVIVIIVSLLAATPVLLLPEFFRTCQRTEEGFSSSTTTRNPPVFNELLAPRTPPTFDDLLKRVRPEEEEQQQNEAEAAPRVEDAATTPEEEKAIRTGKDPYDFIDANPAYAEKDILYYTKKGDLVDKQWTNFYTVLDTKHWKSYVAPPPVCLDREKPCPVCPQVTNHQGFMDLAELSR